MDFCLREIGVTDNQAGIIRFMVTAEFYLCPQLRGDVIHELAPVGTCIIEELVEDILTTPKLAA